MLIQAVNLQKVYQMGPVRVEALKDASFQIEEGEFVAIIDRRAQENQRS